MNYFLGNKIDLALILIKTIYHDVKKILIKVQLKILVILQKIKKTELICNNCNTSRLVTDDVIGEIACSSCGCVISEHAQDRGAEWRNLSSNSDDKRTGAGLSPKMHDKGLFTII